MRIGIDLQGLQSEGSRSRGIGRYSLEIIRNLIKVSPNDHFILIANATLKNIEYEFKTQLNLINVSYFEWSSPCPFDYLSSNHNLSKLACCLKSYACSCLHLDILIITSFFEGFTDNCITELDYDICNVKTLSIFYDLIPLLNSKLYFENNLEFEKFYRAKLKSIKKLDGFLAISQSAASEAAEYLNVDKNLVFNISSACDISIFNTHRVIKPSDAIKSILQTKFLLYTGAGEPRKNLKGLLEAYSLLPSKLKDFKLVLAGNLIQLEKEQIDNWIGLFGIESECIIKTGYISDDDLVVLYRNCYLFIFPSFHEGFGLPVLEAMSCGAPVIGSQVTSIPEIIGKLEAMFDPRDPLQLKQLIQKVLINTNFRDELLINSRIRCKKFSWSNTSRAILKACKKVLENDNNKYVNISYRTILKNNESYLDKLFLKLAKLDLGTKPPNDYVLPLISSAIDKANMQLNFLCRGISASKSIKYWRIEGPFDSNYSFAKINRHFSESLNKKISNTFIYITEGLGDYPININYLRRFDSIYKIFLKSNSESKNIDVISRNLYPPRVNDLESRVNIIHSYGWEESRFPKKWVHDFNTYLQGVTVMSRQVRKILIDSGVRIPVKVSGLGLDHINEIEPDFNFKLKSKNFNFLHISSGLPTKGVDILLNSFCETFSDGDEVSLIIKISNNPDNDVERQVADIKLLNPRAPEIIILNNDMTDEQIKGLLIQSDVLVAPSRGEGFGFPIGEAMRLGVPVITTGWGGQLDFCNNKNSWLIDYKFVFSTSNFDIDQSYWAEPSQKHLSQIMFKVYSSDQESIKIKTNQAKLDTKLFTWDFVADKNINFVENECIKYKSNYFKLGILGTWYSKCAIASYSQNLFSNLNEEIVIFSPYEEKKPNTSTYNVLPSWHLDSKKQSFNDLYKLIISEEITTLFIQFNYGLFCLDRLSELIDYLDENNVSTVILLHSTIDPQHDTDQKLSNIKNSLLKTNRILVHSIDDLNRLKDLGIVDNADLFSHGITDLVPTINFKQVLKNRINFIRRKKIASYGLCLPNKGYKELIHAINILKESGVEISLTIFTPIYIKEYEYLYHELKQLINDLKLNNLVSIESKYMTEVDTLNHLTSFDCIVFPYQESNESSSAAVRKGLASKRPVLVTPINLFGDVSNLVDFLPGVSSNDIASGINQWYESGKVNIFGRSFETREKLLATKRFSYLRERLINTLKSLEVNQS